MKEKKGFYHKKAAFIKDVINFLKFLTPSLLLVKASIFDNDVYFNIPPPPLEQKELSDSRSCQEHTPS